MKSLILGTSLAFQQAIRVLAVSLAAAVLFSAVYGALLVQSVQRDFEDLRDRTALSIRSSLATALWNFDEATAQATVEDALISKPIRSILVVDSNGKLFVAETSPKPETRSLPWRTLLEALVKPRRKQVIALHYTSLIDETHENVFVGKAFIHYDHLAFIRKSSDQLMSQTVGLLVLVLVVALATSLIMHGFLAHPLLQTAWAVERMNPEDPGTALLPVPNRHRKNEFGRMIRRVNRLLERVARVQGDLRRLATRDPLTDLPNRSLILEILDRNIGDSAIHNTRSAVIFLDLDMFKHVNDSLGHESGDEILRTIGHRLEEVVGGQGTAGRFGGDEFVVAISSYDREDDMARMARQIIGAVARPVDMQGTLVQPSASIGIACYPQDGQDAKTLLRNADTAMYAAKASGPGQWSFFNHAMTENALIRLRTEGSLRQAVENGDFMLLFQPKIDIRTGRVVGCEALVRWSHGNDIISPARFIPIAEETGLIYDIGLWVLREACHAQARWLADIGPMSMAVNVSPNQLRHDSFIKDFTSTLENHCIDPTALELEITETAIMRQFDVSVQLLHQLKAFGMKLAIDDFGTGYSSLAYLKKLPIDVLKIDRSFICDLPSETSLPRMILGLSEHLGLRTVAEGIETQEQFDWLRNSGCDMIQGYFVSPPLPEADFPAFIHARATTLRTLDTA